MILVLIANAQMPLINIHAGIFNKDRGQNFGLSPNLQPYLVYESSRGSGESVHMPLLLIDVISTKTLCTGQFFHVHLI